MGGDDLDDDDDIMWMKPVRGGGLLNDDDNDDDDDDDDDDDADKTAHDTTNPKKRQSQTNVNDDNTKGDALMNETKSAFIIVSSSKKRKKESNSSNNSHHNHNSPTQLLLQLGRTIHEQSTIEQAKYLTTAIQHYSLLSLSSTKATTTNPENKDETNIISNNDNDDDNKNEVTNILPQHCLDTTSIRATGQPTTNTTTSSLSLSNHWSTYIRQMVSMKTLREWKHVGSPCIVRVLCIQSLLFKMLVAYTISHFFSILVFCMICHMLSPKKNIYI
jgi:hypothetical protein